MTPMRPSEFYTQQRHVKEEEEEEKNKGCDTYPHARSEGSVADILKKHVVSGTRRGEESHFTKETDSGTLGDAVRAHPRGRRVVVNGAVLLDGVGIGIQQEDLQVTLVRVE